MAKSLPKSLDEIEFVPFVGRKIDLNTKGKPSVYLRNVIIPYYRGVIRGLEVEISNLKKSKKSLLERKNRQIDAKRWLRYKYNQKRYAVQQSRVQSKAVELTNKKVRRSAFEKGDMLSGMYLLPVMIKLSKELGLKINELSYICYTWNFRFLSSNDYRSFFGEDFSMTALNNCRKLGYIDSQKNNINHYYLSVKGKSLVKRIQEESEKLKDE
jgi:hypothetical protein